MFRRTESDLWRIFNQLVDSIVVELYLDFLSLTGLTASSGFPIGPLRDIHCYHAKAFSLMSAR